MDVRCEKCQTEYELDESKVTEAGVTVKCTSCGNLFKIRRRAASQGLPPLNAGDVGPGERERVWLLRSPTGDVRKFRELTQLQQWIVERRVTRECEISRTGDAWKRLGDIAELSSFFEVVEHAQAALKAQAVSRGGVTLTAATPNIPPARGAGGTVRGGPAAGPPPAAPNYTGPSSPTLDDAPSFSGMPSITSGASQEPAWARPGGGDAQRLRPPPRLHDEPDLSSGIATSKRPGSRGRPNFTESNVKTARVAPLVEPRQFQGFGQAELRDSDDVIPDYRQKSRAPIVIGVVLLVAAAGFAVWYFGLHDRGEVAAVAPAAVRADGGLPAAVKPTVAPLPAAALDAAPAPVVTSAPVDDTRPALALLADDTDESFAAAAKLLDGAHVADPAREARVLAAQALVDATWAQALADDADALDAAKDKKAGEARADSARKLTRADKELHDAQQKAPTAPEVALAAAEVGRQHKASAAEIDKLLAGAGGDRAATFYERGMLKWRDGKTAEAEALLLRAVDAQSVEAPGTTHLPARWRLALIAFAGKRYDVARAQLDAVLAMQPKHARAKALIARIDTTAAAAAAVPAPAPAKHPNEPPPPDRVPGQPDKGEPATDTGPVTSGQYAGLVDKGNKLAENGNCSDAINLYEKALDARPSGVEALTGMGYCYLDKKDFPQALSVFRAALGISPHHGEALLGMGDTYRGEGMNAEAADYYRRYLDANPTGSRAAQARRFLEQFGGAPVPPVEHAPPSPADPIPDPPLPEPAPEPKAPAEKPRDVSPPPSDKLPDKSPAGDHEARPAAPQPAPADPAAGGAN